MSQTEYNAQRDKGIRGLADDGPRGNVRGFAAEAALLFGYYVTKGTDPEKQVTPPTDATHIQDLANIGGIVVRDHLTENNVNVAGDVEIRVNDAVAVLDNGDIWVPVEQDVTPDDPVFVRFSASGSEKLGAFRKDDDGGDAAELPNARWIEGGSAGNIAKLAVNF